MRPGFLVLTLCLACGDAGSRHPQVIAADTALGFEGHFSPGQLEAYERGRRQEITALRSGARFTSGAIDSIGAGAAGMALDDYRRLSGAIDGFLKQRLQLTTMAMTVVLPASDSLLALLDSLRVERLVLALQIGN